LEFGIRTHKILYSLDRDSIGGKKQNVRIDPSCFHAESVGPFVGFCSPVFQYVTQYYTKRDQKENRIKHNKNGHEIVFHGREIGCGGWI
jgi:hypothetical protein